MPATMKEAAIESTKPDPAASKRRFRLPGRPSIPAIASVATGTAAIGVHASLYGNWIIDDAAITFAYARSFAEGLGPVVQPGADKVEGFSNPTWTAILALGRLLGLFDHGTIFGIPDYVVFPKALALVFCAGTLAACYIAASRVARRPWLVTLLVSVALAVNPSFVIWSFSGLENALYALTIVWLAVLLFLATLDDRLLSWRVAVLAGGLAAFAALTRPEGMIYGGAYPLVVLFRMHRDTLGPTVRHVLLSCAAFAAPVGVYVAWRVLTFGHLLSSPAVAKGQEFPSFRDLTRPGELVAYAGAPAVLLVAVLVGMVVARPAWWRPGLFALLVPLTLGTVAFGVLEADWMQQYRFATPIWALGTLVAVLVAVEALRNLRTRGRTALAVGLVATILPTTDSFVHAAGQFREYPDISACYVADRFGRVFNGYADILGLGRRASFLLPDLGGTALTSRLRLVDMAGLANHRFAELASEGDERGQQNYVYEELKPTFIHSRQPWTNGNDIVLDPRLRRDYHWIYFDHWQGPPNGDWVRKDAVPGKEKLAELRRYAHETTLEVERSSVHWPLRACGPTLRRGQTAVGLH